MLALQLHLSVSFFSSVTLLLLTFSKMNLLTYLACLLLRNLQQSLPHSSEPRAAKLILRTEKVLHLIGYSEFRLIHALANRRQPADIDGDESEDALPQPLMSTRTVQKAAEQDIFGDDEDGAHRDSEDDEMAVEDPIEADLASLPPKRAREALKNEVRFFLCVGNVFINISYAVSNPDGPPERAFRPKL